MLYVGLVLLHTFIFWLFVLFFVLLSLILFCLVLFILQRPDTVTHGESTIQSNFSGCVSFLPWHRNQTNVCRTKLNEKMEKVTKSIFERTQILCKCDLADVNACNRRWKDIFIDYCSSDTRFRYKFVSDFILEQYFLHTCCIQKYKLKYAINVHFGKQNHLPDTV